jgi:hypothetical protein
MTKGASQALGLMSLAKDFGQHLDARVHCDASAALGIVQRQGLGKLRHINVRYLWLQERIREKQLEVVKVPGVSNPADLLTKNLDAATMWKHVTKLGFHSAPGRAKSAPTLRGSDSSEPLVATLAPVDTDPSAKGEWVQVLHERPRMALVTPVRVGGVPPVRALTAMRITEGRFVRSGVGFRKVDNWTCRREAHRELPEPWTGSTWFKCKEDGGVSAGQEARLRSEEGERAPAGQEARRGPPPRKTIKIRGGSDEPELCDAMQGRGHSSC